MEGRNKEGRGDGVDEDGKMLIGEMGWMCMGEDGLSTTGRRKHINIPRVCHN